MERVRILTYHRVGIPRSGRTERLTVRPDRFTHQLRILRRLPGPACDLMACANWLRGERPKIGRPVILSFDDGYADLLRHAVPRVVEAKLPAIVFLVSERRTDEWIAWKTRGPLSLLDWREVRELVKLGIEIGSHSRTHPDLTRLARAQMRSEITDSKKQIEDETGQEVRHFCYPYGSHDETVVRTVREAGYATACTTRKGVVRAGCDPYRLPRLNVGKRMNLARFLLRLARYS